MEQEREVKKELHKTLRNIHSGPSTKCGFSDIPLVPIHRLHEAPSGLMIWGYQSSLHPLSVQSARLPPHYMMSGQSETDSCDLSYNILDIHSELYTTHWASQVALVVKNPPANAGDVRDARSIPGSGRSPGEGHGNPFQYSCLENPMDRWSWQATVHGVAQSWTWLKQLSMQAHTTYYGEPNAVPRSNICFHEWMILLQI